MARTRILFVSGLSGAGKSHAIRALEDLGYFCVDNLPPPLLPTFSDLVTHHVPEMSHVAIGVDIREREFLDLFLRFFDEFRLEHANVELVFLDADDNELVRRFSETRRPHPLLRGEGTPVIEAIREEREKLAKLRERADRIVATTDLKVSELKSILKKYYGKGEKEEQFKLFLMSFGFKYGLPIDCDLVLDVRFLPNPNYVPDLKPLTGLDKPVRDMVFSQGGEGFVRQTEEYLSYLLPQYVEEGRSFLTLGIGCTGGRHRSVAITEILKNKFVSRGYEIRVIHRDIEK
ncbi:MULTISPECIES: RNase adapter RapZ [Leptospirillum]|uniref:p-loop ATPase n=4 Tax=Leptospirillum ferriphilum TaxID=178606 RepID=A0A059XU84_9BACT|nr:MULTISPECIES: RNase adapter RapZ [Leptospirillum]EAY55720.1 MAG: putative P-loop ATPase protein family [Leptospirillum rubarum]EIJ75788.1 MAG: Putative P-loop ATPase protein family [Leptospirillum sp. Group II 'C75']MCL5259472.1 RNase adapter RapZ [Nitrospirota bacterium]AFS53370.1 putative P-loop ATPase protein family protein [Leptospirillum ferriphilum ML-04]AIA30393.1 P-loop ATPase [Leptospirillum ferriphilum YSK]